MRIAVHEALVGPVLDKSGDEEQYVVKLASEWAPQQVQKILCLTGIGGPTIKALNAGGLVGQTLAPDRLVLQLDVFQLVHELACIRASDHLVCGGEG